MINLQDPIISQPLFATEIDLAILDIQTKLEINLSWLTHAYARAYRHVKLIDNKKVYFPEIYAGKQNDVPSYYRPTPDNDKKGMCFFVVEKEIIKDFQKNQFSYLKYDVGIVFWVNLKLINDSILDTEIFTQNLIAEVRRVINQKFNGVFYRLNIKEVVREFTEIYKEFTLQEQENYLLAPYQAFRFNGSIEFQEDCVTLPQSQCNVLNQNISQSEVLTCFLPNLDFSIQEIFDSLTAQQKADLTIKLGL